MCLDVCLCTYMCVYVKVLYEMLNSTGREDRKDTRFRSSLESITYIVVVIITYYV